MNADPRCCEGTECLTPRPIENAAGASSVRYRIGDRRSFLETMKARLSTRCGCSGEPADGNDLDTISARLGKRLTTRSSSDPALALLDAWATVADVLTFYQERIANEGFLRTARSRRSIVELGRLLGYQLRPGVSATAHLAFLLEETSPQIALAQARLGHPPEASSREIIIPAGTPARSTPLAGTKESPQTFETAEDLTARPEWNILRPRWTKPQVITDQNIRDVETLYLAGTNTGLKPNDLILVVLPGYATAGALEDKIDTLQARRVAEVGPNAERDWTRIVLQPLTLSLRKFIARIAAAIDDVLSAGVPYPPLRRELLILKSELQPSKPLAVLTAAVETGASKVQSELDRGTNVVATLAKVDQSLDKFLTDAASLLADEPPNLAKNAISAGKEFLNEASVAQQILNDLLALKPEDLMGDPLTATREKFAQRKKLLEAPELVALAAHLQTKVIDLLEGGDPAAIRAGYNNVKTAAELAAFLNDFLHPCVLAVSELTGQSILNRILSQATFGLIAPTRTLEGRNLAAVSARIEAALQDLGELATKAEPKGHAAFVVHVKELIGRLNGVLTEVRDKVVALAAAAGPGIAIGIEPELAEIETIVAPARTKIAELAASGGDEPSPLSEIAKRLDESDLPLVEERHEQIAAALGELPDFEQVAKRVSSFLKSLSEDVGATRAELHRQVREQASSEAWNGAPPPFPEIKQRLLDLLQDAATTGDIAKFLAALTEIIEKLEDAINNAQNLPEEMRRRLNNLYKQLVLIRNQVSGAPGAAPGEPPRKTFSFEDPEFQQILQSVVRDPADRQIVERQAKLAFADDSDVWPRLLQVLRPEYRPILYAAWRRTIVSPRQPRIYHLRTRAALFGYNAPVRQNRAGEPIDPFANGFAEDERAPDKLFLDREYTDVQPGSYVAVKLPPRPRGEVLVADDPDRLIDQAFVAASVQLRPRTAYELSGKTTEIDLDAAWRAAGDTAGIAKRLIQGTIVYAESRLLELAEAPVDSDAPFAEPDENRQRVVADGKIILNHLYDGLDADRWIIVRGERADVADVAGIQATEAVQIAYVRILADPHDTKTLTQLILKQMLRHSYRPATVELYANVAVATHGESNRETLGSGDARRPFLQLGLKRPPLTFLPAETPRGVESTLTVRVNDVAWRPIDALTRARGDDRVYTIRTDHQARTSVRFGDGRRGARPPSGVENIRAEYRVGLGRAGNVQPSQIDQLPAPPLGVKNVINPLAASGGADPESRDQARKNIPLAVAALDRLVSVRDYADFARGFAGIAKAVAEVVPHCGRDVVHVTIAGQDDIPISEESYLYKSLLGSLRRFGDPAQAVRLGVRSLGLLVIEAQVKLLPDHAWETVEPKIRRTLLETFSFENAAIGQDVLLSDAMTAVQRVPGVAYVDIDVFQALRQENLSSRQNGANEADAFKAVARIVVNPARPAGNAIAPGEIVYLSPDAPDTLILRQIP